jgi:hypothetical protein
MTTLSLMLFAFLSGAKVRLGLALALFGFVVGFLLLAWCLRVSRNARGLPIILFTGVLPMFLLAFLWPQLRLPILAALMALLLISWLSRPSRRALRLLVMLFVDFMPLILLIGVDDISWSAGFLMVYLGLMSVEPKLADNGLAENAAEGVRASAGGGWYFVHAVSLGFLWILLLSALLWYVPEPDAYGL